MNSVKVTEISLLYRLLQDLSNPCQHFMNQVVTLTKLNSQIRGDYTNTGITVAQMCGSDKKICAH